MKKIVALILVLVMVLSLAACSSGNEGAPTDKSGNTSVSTDNSGNISENNAQGSTGNFSQDVDKDTSTNIVETSGNTENTEGTQSVSHTHNYTSKVTEPTCTAGGFTTYTCACGDTYTDNQTAAKAHSYAAATCVKAATCSCGATNGSALGHTFRQGICTRCSASDPDYQAQDTASKIVYITQTGKKYHSRKTCPGLSNAKAIYDSTLSDAKSSGLEACSKCH